MTISRRMALTGASALAVLGGSGHESLASAATRIAKRVVDGRRYRNMQTSQRFIQLLIHQDENGHTPVSAEISIPANDTAWYVINTLDDTQYRLTNSAYKKRGYRLRWVNAFKTKAGVRYAGCWELTSGPAWSSSHGMSAASFNRKNKGFANRNYRLAYLDTRVNYAAMWEQGDPSSQRVLTALTQTDFEQQYATLVSQNMRPHRVSVHLENGAPVFAAIFEAQTGSSWQAHHQMNAADFHKMDAGLKAQGYRLTDASGYVLNRKPVFSGIWEMI